MNKGNEKGHYVYKYVLNDEIIYIGKTDRDLESRINEHGVPGDNIPKSAWHEINKSDIYFIKLPNATMSDVVESELINRYKPKHNKAKMSDWCGIPFEEPQWEKYEKPVKVKEYRDTRYSIRGKKEFKNHYDRNKKALDIIRFVISRLKSGDYVIEDGEYKVDVQEICRHPVILFADSFLLWDTRYSIGSFCFFSNMEESFDGDEIYFYFHVDGLEDSLQEFIHCFNLEASKYADAPLIGVEIFE